jgi:hypothetical protein
LRIEQIRDGRREELPSMVAGQWQDADQSRLRETPPTDSGDGAVTECILEISGETELWCADAPTHLVHFNGERFFSALTPRTKMNFDIVALPAERMVQQSCASGSVAGNNNVCPLEEMRLSGAHAA